MPTNIAEPDRFGNFVPHYCRMRGIDPALLTRRIADGMLPTEGPHELVDVAQADKALEDALGSAGRVVPRKRGSTAARPGSGRRPSAARLKGLTLHEARVLRAREEVERARIAKEREALELAEMRGELIVIAEAVQRVSEEYTNARIKLLSLPSKLANSWRPKTARRRASPCSCRGLPRHLAS